MRQAEELLHDSDVRPTSNRLIVTDTLLRARGPLSLGELEAEIGTLEKSSILRVLDLLLKQHVVHTIEDGRGIVKYEICHSGSHDDDDDMHVHFYCERCRRTYCFKDMPAPRVDLPEGFVAGSVNYMLKGICPACRKTRPA